MYFMSDPEVYEAAKAHAMRDWPNESVGLVVEGAYNPVPNIAEDPQNIFEFDAKLMRVAGLEAIIHSHTHGNYAPTLTDMEQQLATALPWGIIGASNEATTKMFWWGPGVAVPALVGRPYRFGPSGSDGRGDCYAIIKDWYKLERGIDLKEVPRDKESYRTETPWYDTLFDSYGWVEIQPNEVEAGDVVLMRIRQKVTNHAMLYLGKGLALHHQEAQLSGTCPIGPWLRFRTRCLRYKGVS